MTKIENTITELEQKISTINEQLLNPSTYSQELVDKYTILKKQLEKAEMDWEKAQEMLEKIN